MRLVNSAAAGSLQRPWGRGLRSRVAEATLPLAVIVIAMGTCRSAQADEVDRRWLFEVLGTGLGDVSNRHVQAGGATVGLGYWVLPRTAVMVDAGGYGFSEGRVDGVATGVTVGLRQHLLGLGQFGLDLDVSGGILGANRELPYNGTHFNETIEVGPRVTYKLNDDGLYLVGGVRYFHLSNADRTGLAGRNPSVNAIKGVLGVEWRF